MNNKCTKCNIFSNYPFKNNYSNIYLYTFLQKHFKIEFHEHF